MTMETKLHTDFYKPNAKELKLAFEGAKSNDSVAINKLYQWFNPLVLSVAHSYSAYTALQEDAENIAWECFFQFVKDYNGNDYLHVPGLLKKRLISRLTDIVKSYKYYDPNAVLASESTEYLEVQAKDCFNNILENIYLKDALKELTPMQQKLIYFIYFKDLNYAQISQLLKIKERSILHQHKRAKATLRKHLIEQTHYDS